MRHLNVELNGGRANSLVDSFGYISETRMLWVDVDESVWRVADRDRIMCSQLNAIGKLCELYNVRYLGL
jgi:hypothetical protein